MSYSILIVDDSLPMRSVIKRTVKTTGFNKSQFYEAGNGKEAIELMRDNSIDIVITDFNMPVMNGMEFIKIIKNDKLVKDIPVIVISQEGNDIKIQEFMDLGVSGYITKPFTSETVRDLINDILGKTSYDEDFEESNDDFDF